LIGTENISVLPAWNRETIFMLRVAEVFQSIQGEGLFAGTQSVFLRTTGCNLRCWFCDTPYTSWNPEGQQRPWTEVLADVLAFDCEHVVITGGEPLLQPNIVPLTFELKRANKIITVETAGTVYRPVCADLMSVSPKLSNSTPSLERSERWAQRHAARRINRDVLQQLTTEYQAQLKFVVDRPEDLNEVESFLAEPPALSRDQVWLMPQARSVEEVREKAKWLEPLAENLGFKYSTRLHIELFGNVRGT
jgi:7-carboxy-7-deazaguanine synthase